MMKRAWALLFAIALGWIGAQLHRGQPLGWDEVEFFRATKWVGEGRVPFRDFWEHHTPLQWLVFAPVARWFATGPGALSVVVMRWAQVAAWIVTLFLVLRLTAEKARWPALVLLLSAPLFVRSAIEYRVDVLGNLGLVAALVAATRRRWIAFGVLMSLAVLANMRLAPLVIFTAALMLFWREERWRWNPAALRMVAGVLLVAAPFVGWLRVTNAWTPFLEAVIGYNVTSSELIEVRTLFDMLLAPVWLLDPAAIALWCAAIAGCVAAFRGIREPRAVQIIAVVWLASLVAVAAMEVQYEYHFQGVYLLMVPLVALLFERFGKWEWAALATAAVALFINLLPLASPAWGTPLQYQDFVMREVDRRTQPDQAVFDGTGYALRREPAYRYWFLPAGLRLLADAKKVEPYEIETDPPAAVIYNLRMQRWFEIFPRTAAYAVKHYVPLTRDLWVPGMTAVLPPGRTFTWTAPVGGRYTLWASEPLTRHPWLTRPLEYAAVQGPLAARYAIQLTRLPGARVVWGVEGKAVAGRTVTLRRGDRVTVVSREPRPIGVFLAPSDVRVLATGPGVEFQF